VWIVEVEKAGQGRRQEDIFCLEWQTCKCLESYDKITVYRVFLKCVSSHLGAYCVDTNYGKVFVCVVPWSFHIRIVARFILQGLGQRV